MADRTFTRDEVLEIIKWSVYGMHFYGCAYTETQGESSCECKVDAADILARWEKEKRP